MLFSRPFSVLLVGILFVAISGIGANNLYFRGDYKVFFEDDFQKLIEHEKMQTDFGVNDNIIIVFAPKDKNIFTKDNLGIIKELTDESWQIPYSYRVDSITNYQHSKSDGEDLIVGDLVYSLSNINAQFLKDVKAIAINDPILLNRLVSKEGHVALVNITVDIPNEDKSNKIFEVINFVRSITDNLKLKYPDTQFYHAGIVAMDYYVLTETKKDTFTLIPIMSFVIVVFLIILLKSVFATFSTSCIVASVLVSTMGIAGWLGYFLSTASVNAPVIIMTVVVADCVHLISSMMFALNKGSNKKDAITYSLKLNILPILITSLTTAVGFLTLNFSEVPVLQDLGNITAIGVMLAFIFSITLLPTLLFILPIKTVNTQPNTFNGIATWVIKNHRKLLPLTLVIIVISCYLLSFNKINDQTTKYFSKGHEFREATDFIQNNISGMSQIDFALDSGISNGINNPEVLGKIEKFSAWLREQPEVDSVSTISDILKKLNMNMNGDDINHYQLPDSKELIAQYMLLYEMSLPYGLGLTNQIDMDRSTVKIVATLKNLGSKEFTEFEGRAISWVNKHTKGLRLTAASPALMFAHIGELNMKSMLKNTPLALLLISMLLVFALKSWKMGCISILPNLLPVMMGFGVWGLYSGEINLALSVVSTMTLGIIVDDTVHFLLKYNYARNSMNLLPEASIKFAFEQVGQALLTTTVVLSSGFMVLFSSSFRLSSDMGLLTALIIIFALVVDFLLLPAFLLYFDKRNIVTEK